MTAFVGNMASHIGVFIAFLLVISRVHALDTYSVPTTNPTRFEDIYTLLTLEAPYVGYAAIKRSTPDSNTEYTTIDTGNPLPMAGTINKVEFYTKAAGSVTIRVVDMTTTDSCTFSTTVTSESSELTATAGVNSQTVSLTVTAGQYIGISMKSGATVIYDSGAATTDKRCEATTYDAVSTGATFTAHTNQKVSFKAYYEISSNTPDGAADYLCTSGTHCYWTIVDQTYTYDDATTACSSNGGTLANLMYKTEVDYVKAWFTKQKLSSSADSNKYWVGLEQKTIDSKTQFAWTKEATTPADDYYNNWAATPDTTDTTNSVAYIAYTNSEYKYTAGAKTTKGVPLCEGEIVDQLYCPDGMYSCYKVVTSGGLVTGGTSADTACTDLGGHLANAETTTKSDTLTTWVKSLALTQSSSDKAFWLNVMRLSEITLTEDTTSGKYMWQDTYTQLNPQPTTTSGAYYRISGKYVLEAVTTTDTGYPLCEFEKYRVNVAEGQTARQSSTAWDAAQSVDGRSYSSTGYTDEKNYCSKTNSDTKAWLSIDLQQTRTIQTVKITNTKSSTLTKFNVGLSDADPFVTTPDPETYKVCKYYTDTVSVAQTVSITCDTNMNTGRYLIIQFPTQTAELTICEVEVYADPSPCIGDIKSWGLNDPTGQQNGYIKLLGGIESESIAISTTSTADRGYHLVGFYPDTCITDFTKSIKYDDYTPASYPSTITGFIDSVPDGMIILGATAYDGSDRAILDSTGIQSTFIGYGIMGSSKELQYGMSYTFSMKTGLPSYSTYKMAADKGGPLIVERVVSGGTGKAVTDYTVDADCMNGATVDASSGVMMIDSSVKVGGTISSGAFPESGDLCKVINDKVTSANNFEIETTVSSNEAVGTKGDLDFVIVYHVSGSNFEYIGIRTASGGEYCAYHGSTKPSDTKQLQTKCTISYTPGASLKVKVKSVGSHSMLIVDDVTVAMFDNTYYNLVGTVKLGVASPYGQTVVRAGTITVKDLGNPSCIVSSRGYGPTVKTEIPDARANIMLNGEDLLKDVTFPADLNAWFTVTIDPFTCKAAAPFQQISSLTIDETSINAIDGSFVVIAVAGKPITAKSTSQDDIRESVQRELSLMAKLTLMSGKAFTLESTSPIAAIIKVKDVKWSRVVALTKAEETGYAIPYIERVIVGEDKNAEWSGPPTDFNGNAFKDPKVLADTIFQYAGTKKDTTFVLTQVTQPTGSTLKKYDTFDLQLKVKFGQSESTYEFGVQFGEEGGKQDWFAVRPSSTVPTYRTSDKPTEQSPIIGSKIMADMEYIWRIEVRDKKLSLFSNNALLFSYDIVLKKNFKFGMVFRDDTDVYELEELRVKEIKFSETPLGPQVCQRISVSGQGRKAIPGYFDLVNGQLSNNKVVYKHEDLKRSLFIYNTVATSTCVSRWVVGTEVGMENALLYVDDTTSTIEPQLATKAWNMLLDGKWICGDGSVKVTCS